MIPADPSSDILSDTSRSRGTIYLLRHGAVRSYGNGKRYIGWQDLPLSDAGLEQAGIWAAYFTGLALEEICCSDLVRCRETARIIADRCSLEPQVFPELREVYLGAWDAAITLQNIVRLAANLSVISTTGCGRYSSQWWDAYPGGL